MIAAAVARCAEEIRSSGVSEWVVAYSGGKDSTAALKIFFEGLRRASAEHHSVSVIYCDTGVENPLLDHYVKGTLQRLAVELRHDFPNARVEVLSAPVSERFFVRIIGRGYAPPSNRFRWCTKGLRILPVQRYLSSRSPSAAVVLGLRLGESAQRDRSLLSAGAGDAVWQVQREGSRKQLFLPIVDFCLEMVWVAVQAIPYPTSINSVELEELYRGASDECPMIRSPLSPPCSSGRFGCWTCTVVRRDKSAENLIRQGKLWLKPYLEFRDWLQDFRGRPDMRWPCRRNGAPGPGPFTLRARQLILRELQLLEADIDRELVSHFELKRISELWDADIQSEARVRTT